MSDSVFGQVVTPADVEKATLATMQKWSNTYLRLMERHTGRAKASLANVASWRAADNMQERFPEQQIPACQVMVATDADLYTEGDSMQATFHGVVDILVQSTEPEPARELALLYAYAHGLLLIQHEGLDESVPVLTIGWEKVGTPAVGPVQGRWLALGSITITIGVEGIASPLKGPMEPDEDEPPAYPKVLDHHIILDAETPPETGPVVTEPGLETEPGKETRG